MLTALLCGVLALSGASALVFETLWFRQASLGFGNGVWASSLVLAGFMAGVALGGWLAARFVDRVRDCLRAYAALELAVAVTGVALVYLLPQVHGVLAPLAPALAAYPSALDALRLLFAFALLLAPSTMIGATLPMLVRAGMRHSTGFGRLLGLLYGINTLGAVLGAVASEVVLLPWLGVHGSGWFAAALNLAAASVAFTASHSLAADSDSDSVSDSDSASVSVSVSISAWLFAAFGAGFILLALEVVWLRLLLLLLNDTPLAFAMILALVLTGIALGSLLASAWVARSARPESFASFIAYAAGAVGLGGYLSYSVVLPHAIAARQPAATVLMVAAPLILPTCCASGALFTILGVGLQRIEPAPGRAVGLLALFNTLGSGVGSLVAAFVLLPRLGMEWSLFVLFAAYGAIGFAAAGATQRSMLPRALALGAFALCLVFFPFGRVRTKYVHSSAARWMAAGDDVHVREGIAATIIHVVHRIHGAPRFDQVMTNAYSMTVNGFFGRRYMKLFVVLPSALHPHLRRALVVGYGIGNTTQALTEDPGIERIDVADISRDLLDTGRHMQAQHGALPLDDPRVHVTIEDGRFFLAATRTRYDLITGEPPPPTVAGVVNLYTREYFELLHSRLADGGIATYWLPMMEMSAGTATSIIAAFCSAFSDCTLWNGAGTNFMLMGSRGATGPGSAGAFSRAWEDPRRRRELMAIGIERPSQLGAMFVGDAAYLGELTRGAEPLTDDWPKRIQQPGSDEDREALIARWSDASEARARFARSPWVKAVWPAETLAATAAQFENQTLLDDLLQTKPSWAEGTTVLHKVLHNTRLQLPVLLLMKSDPDIQDALAHLAPAERERPEWLPHRAAERLAMRDFHGALELLERTPDALLPIDDVRDYVAYAVARMDQPAEPTSTTTSTTSPSQSP